MQARIKNPAFLVAEAMPALLALGKATRGGGVPGDLLELVNLRASQINGCAVCVDMHWADLRKNGADEKKLAMVSAWRDSTRFTPEERAALGLAEAVTRVQDSVDPVPDEVWASAAEHFTDEQLGALVLGIASVNMWNRINRATGQTA